MTRFAEAPARQIGAGLAIAACAQLLSFFLAGAGHGWIAPLPASLLLWVLTPLAFLYAWPANRPGRKILLPMVVIALMVDTWLIRTTVAEGDTLPFYLEVNGVVGFLIVGLWLGLWLVWQVVVIAGLLFARAKND